MDKININMDVLNSFSENLKSITFDFNTNVCYEGKLINNFRDIINAGLVPNYFNNLLDNANKLNDYLSSLSNLIGEYSSNLVQLESNISSSVNTKINSDLPIEQFSYSLISLASRISNLIIETPTLVNFFISSASEAINTKLDEFLKKNNISIEELLSGKNINILNEYVNESKSLEELSITLSKMDEFSLQNYLKNILDGVYNKFSTTGSVLLSMLFNGLNNITEGLNTSLSNLINNKENATLLKENIGSIGNSLNNKSRHPSIIDDLKKYAKENDLTIEELLSSNNNEKLTSYIVKVENVSDVIKIFDKYNQKEIGNYLNELYNLDNSKKSIPLSIVFEYLELVSKNNKITLNSLLTNNEYISILLEALMKFNS